MLELRGSNDIGYNFALTTSVNSQALRSARFRDLTISNLVAGPYVRTRFVALYRESISQP